MIPLHLACKNRCSTHLINLLVDINPESCLVEDNDGLIPLHHACAKSNGSNMGAIRILLHASPESVTVKDRKDKTPSQYLQEAASKRSARGMLMLHIFAAGSEALTENTLSLMLDANSDAISSPDICGILPFHHACLNKTSSLEVLMMLVKQYPESLTVKL
mmetsp:Transcript_14555/g.20814  ORF Transcript_14555/g.20814 Transcript_14555/m.20814 type:complete len:161 (+) Transcript_14555:358-840(+)